MEDKIEFLSKLAAEVEKDESDKGKDSKSSGDKPDSGEKKESKKKPPFFAKKNGGDAGDKENKGDGGEQPPAEGKEEKGGNPFAKNQSTGEGDNAEAGKGTPGEEQQEPAQGAGTNQIDPAAIIEFFAGNPTPTDEMFHQFAESNGFDVPAAEAAAYVLAGKYIMLLRGGKSGTAQLDPNSVDPQQLQMGIEVEAEHTDDPTTRKKIALDHLTEDPEYYTKLQQMEGGGEQIAAEPTDQGSQTDQKPQPQSQQPPQ